jgi:ubiquilin
MKDHESLQTHNIKDGLTVHLVIKTSSRTSSDQTSSGPQPRAPGRFLWYYWGSKNVSAH